jgi:antitoxin component of MazEF toxin-antitoxin module
MIKTLRPMGNSYGIIIDKPILALLGIDQNTPLEITTQDGALVLRPIKEAEDHKTRVRRVSKEMVKIHRKVLKELAD